MSNQELTNAVQVRRKTSERKAAANRRNAVRSTGPRSDAGKAVVAANAVRHGLLSWRPVLPAVERAEDWEQHLQRTHEALAPFGHLEVLLAERLALLTWRLNRLARYEAEVLAGEQDGVAGRTGRDDALTDQERALKTMEDLAAQSAGSEVNPELAEWVIEKVADHAEVVLDTAVDPTFVEPEWFPRESSLSEFDGWTASRLREYLACTAARAGTKPDRLWDAVISVTRQGAEASRREKEVLTQRRLERARVSRLVPPAHRVQPIQRYEAAIERSLFRTLHELQRLQATRKGQSVVPPLVVDVDVSGQGGPAEAALCDAH